ncbi:hypothetical protein LAJ55_13555, partial [Streptococcus pneumoniae]|uniref:hypothetical protein n=1 Tax=Streptococcus pneumoniae TaxID=1313 RepID=UPI001CBE1222
ALREEFLANTSQNDKNKEFNSAANFMLEQMYDECIEAYQLLQEKYPSELGTCQAQIGAAYFFKDEFEKAISYYILAKENGADEGMMDDNVW